MELKTILQLTGLISIAIGILGFFKVIHKIERIFETFQAHLAALILKNLSIMKNSLLSLVIVLVVSLLYWYIWLDKFFQILLEVIDFGDSNNLRTLFISVFGILPIFIFAFYYSPAIRSFFINAVEAPIYLLAISIYLFFRLLSKSEQGIVNGLSVVLGTICFALEYFLF